VYESLPSLGKHGKKTTCEDMHTLQLILQHDAMKRFHNDFHVFGNPWDISRLRFEMASPAPSDMRTCQVCWWLYDQPKK